MKKFFLLLAAISAVSFTACDKDDEKQAPKPDTDDFKGTLVVTSIADETKTYSYDDKRFTIVKPENGKLTLWMNETQFVPEMPKLTMEVPGIASTKSGSTITLTGDKIVPQMGGKPYEQYTITNLTGSIADALPDDSLEVKFDCMGFHVEYKGKEID